MGLEGGRQLGALGVRDRDQVLDAHRVEHLAAEALGGDAGADALAGRVDRRGRAGRTSADHEDVERVLLGELLRGALVGAVVELGDDLLEGHATRGEQLAVAEHGRHGHDPTVLGLVLEDGAVDGHVLDPGVEDAEHVEGLHHVGAVLAAEREEGLEDVLPLEVSDLLDGGVVGLRRVPTDVEQGEDEGGELVAERDAGEADLDVGADAGDGERRAALVVVGPADGDLVRQARDLVEQLRQLGGLLRVVEGRHQLDRVLEVGEVGLQLVLERGVEHVGHLLWRSVERAGGSTVGVGSQP